MHWKPTLIQSGAHMYISAHIVTYWFSGHSLRRHFGVVSNCKLVYYIYCLMQFYNNPAYVLKKVTKYWLLY